MSTDYDSHLILHHLDDPLRILLWTVDEALMLIIPPFVGLASDMLLTSIIGSGLGFWGLRKFKKLFGEGTLRHVFYWYFPHMRSIFKCTPPSHIRLYLG